MTSKAPRGAGDRLIYLLKLIAEGAPQFSLGELAEQAGLPASTVHRLLQVLLRSGMVERGAGQSYRPGRELHRMASQLVAGFDLVRSARPFLETLVAQWQETAVLCVYSPVMRTATIADVVVTPHPLRFSVDRGVERALGTGIGIESAAIEPPRPAATIEAIPTSDQRRRGVGRLILRTTARAGPRRIARQHLIASRTGTRRSRCPSATDRCRRCRRPGRRS